MYFSIACQNNATFSLVVLFSKIQHSYYHTFLETFLLWLLWYHRFQIFLPPLYLHFSLLPFYSSFHKYISQTQAHLHIWLFSCLFNISTWISRISNLIYPFSLLTSSFNLHHPVIIHQVVVNAEPLTALVRWSSHSMKGGTEFFMFELSSVNLHDS